MPGKKSTTYYEVLVALFVTTLIVSNIASVKLVQFGSIVFDAGTILFPLAYIIGDIITEIYGFRRMRKLIYTGLGMLALTTLTFGIVQVLPEASDWGNQAAYDTILGFVWRIVGASMAALLIGELINSFVLAKLKVMLDGRRLWHRLIGSTAIGSLLDTVIFSTLAFAGTIPAGTLLSIIATVYVVKVITEVALSPVTMRVIAWLKRHEKLDVFEDPTFSLRG